jgi:hypothetical protein
MALPKHFVESDPLEFALTQPMDYERLLHSPDRREEFVLTVERGRRRRIRLKYQTRARRVLILARLDIHGNPHKNPPTSPYRPDETLDGTHLHLYREGFADRVAFLLPEAPGWLHAGPQDGQSLLVAFLHFCTVQTIPPIQLAI